MRGCASCLGPCGCGWNRPTRRSPACTKRVRCSRSRWRTAMGDMWWSPARPLSSRRRTAWCGAMCGTTRTGRRTRSPGSRPPVGTWWGSCRTRSAATPRPWAARTAPVSFTRWRLDMRRSTLLTSALLMIATSGCKQITEQVQKIKAKIAAARQRAKPVQPVPELPDTPRAAPAQDVGAKPPAPPKKPARQAPAVPLPTRDVPYNSPDACTIAPGMREREIYSMWGPAIAVRHQGDMTFLYYPNGCEYTCGTADVVFLQNGQVVDAVLRWPGHGYSGQSSSPAATPPHGPVRPGGDTLTVKTPSTP